MANVQVAVEYVLRLEDETLSGAITDIPGDAGGKTRFGLASTWHKELIPSGYYSTMPTGPALLLAGQVLQQQYAHPMRITAIDDQTVANIFLAYDVNEDPKIAVEAMQRAIVQLQPGAVNVDGFMGPITLGCIDRCMPISLAACFRLQMIAHYVAKAHDNVLRGLCRRALA